jgi:hypothetical protein
MLEHPEFSASAARCGYASRFWHAASVAPLADAFCYRFATNRRPNGSLLKQDHESGFALRRIGIARHVSLRIVSPLAT